VCAFCLCCCSSCAEHAISLAACCVALTLASYTGMLLR
jgi:hypothetical protein